MVKRGPSRTDHQSAPPRVPGGDPDGESRVTGTARVDLAKILRSFRRNEGSVYLRIRAHGEAEHLAEVVRSGLPPGAADDPVGTWPPVPVAAGTVVLYVSYADSEPQLEGFLQNMAEHVSAAAGECRVDTFRPAFPPVARPGTEFFCTVVALSLRLTSSGREPGTGRERYSRTDVVPEAISAMADLVVPWCRAAGGQSFVGIGMTGLEVSGHDLDAVLRPALRDPEALVSVTCTDWPRAARQVSFTPDGRVLFLFGRAERYDEPDAAIHEALTLMRAAADVVEYGYALRGTRALPTPDQYLSWDWPPMPEVRAGQINWLRRIEGTKTYDAFGMQLLPSAAAATLPKVLSSYDRQTLGYDATVLIHREAARWFADRRPPEQDLAAARAELRPLLLTATDVQHERGHFRDGV
jgi:hypothetical protein